MLKIIKMIKIDKKNLNKYLIVGSFLTFSNIAYSEILKVKTNYNNITVYNIDFSSQKQFSNPFLDNVDNKTNLKRIIQNQMLRLNFHTPYGVVKIRKKGINVYISF